MLAANKERGMQLEVGIHFLKSKGKRENKSLGFFKKGVYGTKYLPF